MPDRFSARHDRRGNGRGNGHHGGGGWPGRWPGRWGNWGRRWPVRRFAYSYPVYQQPSGCYWDAWRGAWMCWDPYRGWTAR